MNKIRIIGLLILVIGLIVKFNFKNDVPSFIIGLLIGIGIALLSRGRFGKKKQQKSELNKFQETKLELKI